VEHVEVEVGVEVDDTGGKNEDAEIKGPAESCVPQQEANKAFLSVESLIICTGNGFFPATQSNFGKRLLWNLTRHRQPKMREKEAVA